MYKRFTTVAGRTVIVRKTETSRAKTEKQKRKPRTNPTPEAVAKINKNNQIRELTAKLNNNFKGGDKWVTLEYPEKLSMEDAMEQVSKFKRRIRNLAKKKGITYKMIETTGIGKTNGKAHHHIVMTGNITRSMIIKFWPEEYVHIEPLWESGNYWGVAKYMLKNAHESKDKRGKYKKAFRCSRNVVTPETRVEPIKRPITYDVEDLTPHEGYYIDRDTIQVYKHPITEALCIEYIEVSLTEEPRIKKYKRGKAARNERRYKELFDEQLSFGWLDI